jgi:hypothetical protein
VSPRIATRVPPSAQSASASETADAHDARNDARSANGFFFFFVSFPDPDPVSTFSPPRRHKNTEGNAPRCAVAIISPSSEKRTHETASAWPRRIC